MSAATELTTIVAVPPTSSSSLERGRRYERAPRASSRPHDVEQDDEPANAAPRREHELAPVDGGAAAWRLLCAAFVFEALLWGFPLSFGVFQEHYSKLPEFAGNPYVSVVGTVASGLGYLGAPVVMPLVQRYEQWRRPMIWVGCACLSVCLVTFFLYFVTLDVCDTSTPSPVVSYQSTFFTTWLICMTGLALGSFATTLEVLILTQGAAYGLGFLALYYPVLSMVNEYWVARRGLAYGVLCGASGLAGAVMPWALQALLARYGHQTTLRAAAVGLALLTAPFLPLLRGRLPPSQTASTIPPRFGGGWAFLRSPLFWVYSVANLLQGLGYFFPALYLPSYASSLGLSGVAGALLLALMSVSQVAGQFAFGLLSDQRHNHRRRGVPLSVLACTSTTVAAVACLALWGPARSLPALAGFAVVYGFFGAGFTAVWARISTAVVSSSSSSDDATAAPMVFGLLNFGKGIGNVLAGPVGGFLVGLASDHSRPSALTGTNHPPSSSLPYRWVIVFTGACMFASACTICLRYLKYFTIWVAR